MIEVGRYLEKFHADIARSQLEASGIWAAVMTDNEGGMAPHLSFVTGVRLMVRKEDEAAAREILAAIEVQPAADEASEEEDKAAIEAAAIKQRVKTALTAAVLSLVFLPIVGNIWSISELRQLPPRRSLPADLRMMVSLAILLNFLVLFTLVILTLSARL